MLFILKMHLLRHVDEMGREEALFLCLLAMGPFCNGGV